MDESKWRYFVVRRKQDRALVHVLSYRDAANPEGEVDPSADDWYKDIKKRFPQDTFKWDVVAMPANTSPWTHPDELEDALEEPCLSDSWPSNDEVAH